MSVLLHKTPGRVARAAPPGHRAQLAAVVALIALGGVLAVTVYAVITAAGDLLLALVSVFLLAFSAWFVLTRRHVARLLGLPGVLLGLLGMISFVGGHPLELIGLVAVLALFGFAGRYAMSHGRATLEEVHGKAEPARRGVLIINPGSGGGKATRFDLPEEARKRGLRHVLLEPGDDLRELATKAVTDGADVIGMAGGDGSQATVAGVAMEHDVAHVCVPAGTRNHFALDLGLDRDDVVGALDAFTDGIERRIDLASVNERIFVNNASIGVYAQVVQEEAYRDAKFGTWRRMLPEMLGPERSIDLQFEGPDERDWVDATLVVVSNNPYQLRRFSGAGTRPRLNTGRLGILATRIRGSRDLAKLVTLTTVGQSRRFRGLFDWSCPKFEIRSGASVPVGLDGEALLLAPPLRFVSLPCALRVRVPHHATGVSPAAAAVALTRADLTALLRIAVGKPCAGVPAKA